MQRAEGRAQKSDDRKSKAEDRKQKAQRRRHKAEDRICKTTYIAEARNQKALGKKLLKLEGKKQ